MNTKSYDKAVSRILRKRTAKNVPRRQAHKLQEELEKVAQTAPEEHRHSLIRAFEIVSIHGAESRQLAEAEYIASVQDLLSGGYREAGVALFLSCIAAISRIDFEQLTTVMPDTSCIDKWIKNSKAQRRSILKSVSESYEKYYGTAWCDWYIKKARIKDLLPFAFLAMQDRKRSYYLPEPAMLLVHIMARDCNFVLTDQLRMKAIQDVIRTRQLVLASSRVPTVGEAYARNFGRALAVEASGCYTLFEALDDLARVRDSAQFAAQFAAHVATTWCLTVDSRHPPIGEVEGVLLDFGPKVWLLAQESWDRDLWFACTTRRIAEKILQVQGKISTQGALQIALGLRSAETDADSRDAMWSTAFNLGIREIGKEGAVELFDPLLHEDLKGGLLRGDEARIVRCGWNFSESVLLRAQVKPV